MVNPSTPVGPCDVKPTPTGRILVEAAAGRMPAYVDTGLNLVHVDDVAAGHAGGTKHGRPGERYILGGDDFTLQQILKARRRARGPASEYDSPASLVGLSARCRRRRPSRCSRSASRA